MLLILNNYIRHVLYYCGDTHYMARTPCTGSGIETLRHHAKAKDVATGIEAEAKHYYSVGGAKEHARTNLKASLLVRGNIRKD